MYIHLLGAILVFGVAALLDSVFSLETHLSELPAKRPHEFVSDYFVEGSLLFILYSLYVIVAAVVMVAYDVPSGIATEIAKGGGLLARWVVRVPGLRWITPPRPNFPQEPIGTTPFMFATGGFVEARLSVLVKMKTGDITTARSKHILYYRTPSGRRTSLLDVLVTLQLAHWAKYSDSKISPVAALCC